MALNYCWKLLRETQVRKRHFSPAPSKKYVLRGKYWHIKRITSMHNVLMFHNLMCTCVGTHWDPPSAVFTCLLADLKRSLSHRTRQDYTTLGQPDLRARLIHYVLLPAQVTLFFSRTWLSAQAHTLPPGMARQRVVQPP